MATLRSRVIRLAHENPGLRPHLLPLLRKHAREMNWEGTFQGDHFRLKWADHPDNAIQVEEMPGKPVKRRVRKMHFSTMMELQWFHPGSQLLVANIMQDVRLSKSMTYDQVIASIKGAVQKALDSMVNEAAKLREKYPTSTYSSPEQVEKTIKDGRLPESLFHETTVSFLEVEPADYRPITFKGRDFRGTSEWGEFRFSADKDEDEYMRQVEGMQAFYQEKSKGAARKLFVLLKADPDAVRNMTFDQFKAMLDRAQIGYSYVPTVWR